MYFFKITENWLNVLVNILHIVEKNAIKRYNMKYMDEQGTGLLSSDEKYGY